MTRTDHSSRRDEQMPCVRRFLTVIVLSVGGGACERPGLEGPATSIRYALNLTMGDVNRPPREMPPNVFIDGVETRTLEVDYPDLEVLTSSHHVELRIGTIVIAAKDTDLNDLNTEYTDCNALIQGQGQGRFTMVQVSMCEYDSGDLRNGLPQWNGPNGGCVADFGCAPSCTPGTSTCAADQRCTSRASSLTPLFTHLSCAPIGDKQLGESCHVITDPLGAYDDCGNDLLCVTGTCHATCRPLQGGCTTCSYVDGEPPELGACL